MEELLVRLRKVKDEKKVDLYKTFLKHCNDIQTEREMILKLLGSTSANYTEALYPKKRKSPEVAFQAEKLSPEVKRLSTGFEQFLAQEGFHWDATRLKKEQLLELLQKKGIQGYSMKNLKGQMIDALKASFQTQEVEDGMVKDLCSTSETPSKNTSDEHQLNSIIGTTISKTPARKGSLMSEFRNLVNGNTTQSQSNEEWVRKEFENRQSRHRDSQIRKSVSESKEKEFESSDTPNSVADDSLRPKEEVSAATWVEVASPTKADNGDCVEKLTETEVELQVQSVIAGIEAVSVDPLKANKKVPGQIPISKPIIPSLEKARQAKAAEEQKLLAKKKEQEAKMSSKQMEKSNNKPVIAKKGIFNMFTKSSNTTNSSKAPIVTASLAPISQSQKPIENTQIEVPKEMPAQTVTKVTISKENTTQQNLLVAEQNPPLKEVDMAPPQSNLDETSPVDEYVIETRDDSSEEGNSDTDDETSDKKQQNIPEWARGDLLKQALEKQYGLSGHPPMDPDIIFPEVQTCSLEEIFGRREGLTRKYASRTSSAHWDADQLTPVEKRQYRQHMGYEQRLSVQKQHIAQS